MQAPFERIEIAERFAAQIEPAYLRQNASYAIRKPSREVRVVAQLHFQPHPWCGQSGLLENRMQANTHLDVHAGAYGGLAQHLDCRGTCADSATNGIQEPS